MLESPVPRATADGAAKDRSQNPAPGFLERLRMALEKQLSRRSAAWLSIAASLLLASPSLASGLGMDDYFHRILLQGMSVPGLHERRFDLFAFANGDAVLGRAQQDLGILAWWADPAVKLAYLRPISSATHVLDYALWPDRPVLMHVQNLVWLGLSLVLLQRLYRRLETPWIACLALLLYGIDDAHGFAISWIANRNAMVALVFGLCVLLLHDGWRRERRRWSAVASPVMLVVALLSGESALAVCAYLFSYALFVDPAGRKSAIYSLAPYAAIVVVWRLVYTSLGYGAEGSGLSIDPAGDPAAFAAAIAERLPVLLTAGFAFPPSEGWVLYPMIADWVPALAAGWVLLIVAALAALFWPLLVADRNARFWALGALLGSLPACAQVPHDRLLFWTGIGAAGLLARFFVFVLRREPAVYGSAARRRFSLIAAGVLFAVHVPFAAGALPLRAQAMADVAEVMERAAKNVPDAPDVENKSVVLVNPPGDAIPIYLQLERIATGRHAPAHMRWLATGASAVTVERLDERRLRVTPADGFLSWESERMQRSLDRPMPIGHEVRLSDMTIRVLRHTPDRRPAEVEVTFAEPLESPSLLWFEWTAAGFQRFQLPSPGQRVTLPKIDYYAVFDP
jgi:hypothetical protein